MKKQVWRGYFNYFLDDGSHHVKSYNFEVEEEAQIAVIEKRIKLYCTRYCGKKVYQTYKLIEK